MTFFRRRRVANSEAGDYASAEDFHRVFSRMFAGGIFQEDAGVSLRWSCRKLCKSRRSGTE